MDRRAGFAHPGELKRNTCTSCVALQTAGPNDSDPAAVAGQEPDGPQYLVQDSKGSRWRMQLIYVEVAGGQSRRENCAHV